MNEKFFLGFEEDNFEVESRMIETGVASGKSIADLTNAEKAEIFGPSAVELEFTVTDAIEMTR
jgi:hypothetical protein